MVRYFGSKERLFAEAVADSFDLMRSFANVDRSVLGEGFADMLFSEQRSDDLLAIMVRAAVDPAVQPMVRQLAEQRILEPMAVLIGGSGAHQRASLIISIVTGVWLYRFLLPIGPLTGEVSVADRRRVADLIQEIIDNKKG